MADSYITILLSKPLNQVWHLFLLGLARILPTIALTPFFGGKTIADPLKIGLGISFVAIILPFIVLRSNVPVEMDFYFLLLLVKEVAIGAFMGMVVSIPFYYTQGAGAIIDHQSGGQSLQVMDPSTEAQTSPTGSLYNNVLLALFFSIGGPILFFDATLSSFTVVPVDQFLPPSFFDITKPGPLTILGTLQTVMTISVQLSAPPVVAMMMSDLFLGIANRMAPQVQISFLLWSLKAYVGMALVWAGWWFVFKQITFQATSWMKFFQKFIPISLS